MGTRGLVIVRCRGRYFIYYNQFDSYPEGLGEAIVQEIPEEPEKYREWLESKRKIFSGLVQTFEEHCLPVSAPCAEKDFSLAERYRKSFLAVDDRLTRPPLQTLTPDWNRIFIEWTYIVDLDRELFGVDESVYFQLSRLPRRWAKYLGLDIHGRRVLLKDTPEDIIGNVARAPEVNNGSRATSDALGIEVVSPEVFFSHSSEILVPREALLLTTFSITHGQYRMLLDQSVLEWTPECFSFRELAFAILSIAAGEVTFESPRALDRNYGKEGYYLIPDTSLKEGQHSLLPLFLHECHLPGVEPGSAPKNTTYWFSNVFIYLASRIDLAHVEEAAVAGVVEAGLAQGLNEFRGIVFSITDVILMHVIKRSDGGVRIQRSDLMNLIYFDDKNSKQANGPRSRGSGSPRDVDPEPELYADPVSQGEDTKKSSSAGASDAGNGNCDVELMSEDKKLNNIADLAFTAMIRFFDTAAKLSLEGAKSHTLPNEILSTIMRFTDARTYKNLASVSACCRQTSDRVYRLNDEYAVVGIGTRNASSSRFIVEDLHSGEEIESKVNHPTMEHSWSLFGDEGDDDLQLNPVIGIADAARRIIMSSVTLTFSNVPPKDNPYMSEVHSPNPEAYYWGSGGDRPMPEKLFEIPKYQYPGFVENAWGRYIAHLIQQSTKSPSYRHYLPINGAQYECLLPPRYRELRMEHYCCNGLQAFIRHPQDDSPEEWERTLKHVVRRLGRFEHAPKYGYLVRGHPVIVAFGTRLKLFYYINRNEKAPVIPPNASPSSIQFAASCTDPEPKNRLLQLMPGNEPSDLNNKEDRADFESWIKTFCGSKDYRTEWDPITEGRQPLIEKAKKSDVKGEDKDKDNNDEVSENSN